MQECIEQHLTVAGDDDHGNDVLAQLTSQTALVKGKDNDSDNTDNDNAAGSSSN